MTTPRWGTVSALKASMGVTGSSDDAAIELALLSAVNAVGLACRRDFAIPSGGATTRKYVPDGDVVRIDDLADSTGLVVLDYGTAVTLSTQVQYQPLNGIGPNGVSGWPITQLRLLDTDWYSYRQTATVSVTSAKWGWTATPDAVVDATYLLAKDVFNSGKIQLGSGVDQFGNDIGAAIINSNAVVRDLLEVYRKKGAPSSITMGRYR